MGYNLRVIVRIWHTMCRLYATDDNRSLIRCFCSLYELLTYFADNFMRWGVIKWKI